MITYQASTSEASSSPRFEVQVSSKSYNICNISTLVSLDKILRNLDENPVISGRVSWDQAIKTTFGSTGQKLLESSHDLGQIIGTAARIFEAVAQNDPNDLDIWKARPWTNSFRTSTTYAENSYGIAFVHFAPKLLPELSVLDFEATGNCLKYSLAAAADEFHNALGRLASLCACTWCYEPEDLPLEWYKHICLPLLAETVVVILVHLSLVWNDNELEPYRRGIEGVYRHYEFMRATVGVIPRIRYVLDNFSTLSVYEYAQLIYTGRNAIPIKQYRDLPPAFSHKGMTFNLDILREFSDQAVPEAILHVVPGTLSLESGHRYSLVQDSPSAGRLLYQATNHQPLSNLPHTLEDIGSEDLGVNLAVTEKAKELLIEYCFTRAIQLQCSTGITELVGKLVALSTSRRCTSFHRDTWYDPSQLSLFTVDGEGRVDPDSDKAAGRQIVIRRLERNMVARCMALQQYKELYVDRRDTITTVEEENIPRGQIKGQVTDGTLDDLKRDAIYQIHTVGLNLTTDLSILNHSQIWEILNSSKISPFLENNSYIRCLYYIVNLDQRPERK